MLNIKSYILGGKSTFTLKSARTGAHLTFKVRQPKPDAPHFVSVMTGTDNESSYTFLGTVFNGADYRHGRNSRIGTDAPSAQAFVWLWRNVTANGAIPVDGAELLPSGKCCRCGRTLTTPESIAAGIGPECAGRLGL